MLKKLIFVAAGLALTAPAFAHDGGHGWDRGHGWGHYRLPSPSRGGDAAAARVLRAGAGVLRAAARGLPAGPCVRTRVPGAPAAERRFDPPALPAVRR